MGSWKTLAIAVLVSISAHTAAEPKGSYENSMMMITLAPTTVLSATTGLSELAARNFKPAKADALAFIGSDGEIRGAQFEQAVRYYHTAYKQPLMSDQQLAQAIATSF
ncbi:Holliday junction resolvase [Pseudomonas ogarae]|uniref:Holliday junction resolvase n=2 Tax=Pseudomonas TaxID=286 RepID=A0A0F4XQY3_9PSED|nr:Holliday junction resolvase [Pseudomonas ogarae]